MKYMEEKKNSLLAIQPLGIWRAWSWAIGCRARRRKWGGGGRRRGRRAGLGLLAVALAHNSVEVSFLYRKQGLHVGFLSLALPPPDQLFGVGRCLLGRWAPLAQNQQHVCYFQPSTLMSKAAAAFYQVWDWVSQARPLRILRTRGGDPCLLYHARLWGRTLDELRVAAGTVFNQVRGSGPFP